MRPLLVGESPMSTGGLPFVGPGSGTRLLALLGVDRLADVVDAVNLFPDPVDRWDPAEARRRAAVLVVERGSVTWLLAGRRVAAAFGLAGVDLCVWTETPAGPAAVIPHPSGRNRWWNDPERTERVLRFVRAGIPAGQPV